MDKDEIFLIKKLQFLIEILERYGVKVSDFEFFNEDKPYSVVLDFSEHDKVFEDKIASLEKRMAEMCKLCVKNDIYEIEKAQLCLLRDENKKLKQRIAELESRETLELPFDALETANYLINATYDRETNGFERTFHNLPDKVNSDRYTVDDLEQIAEHLLVYCKHNKESE